MKRFLNSRVLGCLAVLMVPFAPFQTRIIHGANVKPVVSSISPTSVMAGAASFTLTVNGSNFSNGSYVIWTAGASAFTLTPSSVTPTQIKVTIPNTLFTAAGTVTVTVYQPGKGGGSSNGVNFTVNAGSGGTTGPLTITTTSLAAGTVGTAYNAQLTATGGTTPYSWRVASGAPPTGLTFGTTGSLTGTPSASGTFSFTAQVSDAAAHSATFTYSVAVGAGGGGGTVTITLSPTALTAGTVGTAYSQALSASGGTSPYTFKVSAGTLPVGLSLTGNTIGGTPTTTGTSTFTMQATDSALHSGTLSYTLGIASGGGGGGGSAPFFTSDFSTAMPAGFSFYPTTDAAISTSPPPGGPSANALLLHFHVCGIPNVPKLSYIQGGTLPQTTYYVKLTAVDPTGTTTPSAEVNVTVPAGNLLVVNLPPAHPDRITGVNVFVGTTAGGETLQTVAPIAQGTAWTEPLTGLVAGTAPPTAFTITDCGTSAQDWNRWLSTVFTGLNAIYVRMYLYMPTPQEDDANRSQQSSVQRKLIWLADSTVPSNNVNGSYQLILTSFGAHGGVYTPTAATITLVQQANPGSCGYSQISEFPGVQVTYDAWHELEWYVKLNTPGSSDGIGTIWLDGTQAWTSSTVNWRGTCTTPISFVDVGEQANRYNYLALDEYRYLENVAIGTSFIP